MTFTLSRRSFLKLAGITGISLSLPDLIFADYVPDQGRILYFVEAQARPTDTPIRERGMASELYLPDSVRKIFSVQDGWVRVSGGYIPEDAIQPMLPRHGYALGRLPVHVEVSAPYVALRAFCTANAPLKGRVGHGAVLLAQDSLTDANGDVWLKTHYNQQNVWFQASHVQRAITPKNIQATHAVYHKHTLMIYRDENIVATIQATHPPTIKSGTYTIRRKQFVPESNTPWHLEASNGIKLHGIHSHNNFKQETATLELPILGAKLVFASLPIGAKLIIP